MLQFQFNFDEMTQIYKLVQDATAFAPAIKYIREITGFSINESRDIAYTFAKWQNPSLLIPAIVNLWERDNDPRYQCYGFLPLVQKVESMSIAQIAQVKKETTMIIEQRQPKITRDHKMTRKAWNNISDERYAGWCEFKRDTRYPNEFAFRRSEIAELNRGLTAVFNLTHSDSILTIVFVEYIKTHFGYGFDHTNTVENLYLALVGPTLETMLKLALTNTNVQIENSLYRITIGQHYEHGEVISILVFG